MKNSSFYVDASTKSTLFEQLKSLGNKFDSLAKEEISDYEEMESKIASVVEEFCSLEYTNESVCQIRIYIDSIR